MNFKTILQLACLLLCLGAAATPARARDTRPASASRKAALTPPADLNHDLILMDQDFVLEEGLRARRVILFNGDATIRGRVAEDLLVINGKARVDGAVDGHLAVLGGQTVLGPNARIGGVVALVGSELKQDPAARIGDALIELWSSRAPRGMVRTADWVRDGLLQGRFVVPSHPWTWPAAGVCLLIALALNALVPKGVDGCMSMVQNRPVGAFISGVFILIFTSLLLLLLTISLVGLPAVPFLLTALALSVLFGTAAICRLAGHKLASLFACDWGQGTAAALTLGALLCFAAASIPLAGGLLCFVLAPVGVGAATRTALDRLRREKTVPASLPAPGAALSGPPPAPATPPVYAPGAPATPGMPAVPPLLGALDPACLARAGFWRRFVALVLDVVLFGFLASLLPHADPRVILLLWWGYHIVFWQWHGATVGGIIMNTRLVRLDGQPLSLPVLIVRSVTSVLSALALFLGFFWAGWTRQRQSWHDMAAGTVIVCLPSRLPR